MTDQADHQRILLIKPSSLGDVVHALPVLHGLRERFPSAHIAWLISTACAPLIRHHPELNEVIEFDRRRFGRIGRSMHVSRQFARFVSDLRAKEFDLAIDLQGLFRSGFLTLASRASMRIGFRSARELAWIFYTHEIDTPDPELHAVDKNYRIASVLGFDHVPVTFNLAVTDAERQRAADLLGAAGVTSGEPFVAILPGARGEAKRWLPERYTSVVSRLAVEHRVRTLLMGTRDEADLCAAIAANASAPRELSPVNLAGRSGVREMVAILERASVVVCQDSAPAHIAAALGRPIVCILGPTNPRRTGPYASHAYLLQADLPCVPCYLRSLTQCPHGHECMHQVDVDPVVRATASWLEKVSG
ncbi:MAG: lipopolysaccharide heptosyltransferase II [Phycisphaerales bacterium]|nr:MAG: lipopolysaccharide heptosyltransferase II [Phycisphaerales bacterium]